MSHCEASAAFVGNGCHDAPAVAIAIVAIDTQFMMVDTKLNFPKPKPYTWVVDKGLAGFSASSALQPWYFLPENEMFQPTAKWPHGPSAAVLVAFARRQDCDDIACFEVREVEPTPVVLIHAWTANGYDIVARYDSLWEWLKAVIDDIAEVSDSTVHIPGS